VDLLRRVRPLLGARAGGFRRIAPNPPRKFQSIFTVLDMISSRLLATAILCITGMAIVPSARAQTTISVSANPGALTVSTAMAGSAPLPVSDASTTYSVQSETAGQKITAVLDAPLPAGMTLEVELAAPSGAVSAGRISLSTVQRTLVHDLPAGQFSGLSINYYLTAATSAGVVSSDVRTVTFTITP
jgi:hypothetical protein